MEIFIQAKNKVVLLVAIFGISFQLNGQVVFSDPPFINPNNSIQIIFDASEGNKGLENCNCDIYLHTGTITDRSSGLGDWRYVQGTWGQVIPELRMTSIGNNKYIFNLTPKTFYGVPDGEEIEFLSFVFRNADGTQAGRAEDGADIYLEVVSPDEGLQVILQQPATSTVVLEEGQQTIPIIAHSSQDANWTIRDESNSTVETYTVDNTTLLDYQLPVINDGEVIHRVSIEAEKDGEVQALNFEYVVVAETVIEDPDTDTPAGLTVMENGKLRLKLVAPGKANVQVLNNFNGFKISGDSQMKRSTNGDFFWIDVEVDPNTEWFLYQYLVDANLNVADPMSTLVLDPWNDNQINDAYFPDYPSEATGFVSAEKITGHSFNWTDQNYERPASSELIVYEVLMRDFLASHSYEDLTDTLDYLDRLGINAIELMPVSEFEGNDSWGYNPSFHMALDKYYGNPIEFKNFVNEAHKRGIAVILDVVYNHAFSQSPLCQLYWDANGFKPSSDNPWLNVDAKHPFNVGYDFNHESPYTKQWVKEVQQFWTEEYHIDGYRFDLSKGFTQRNNPNDVGAWSAYDQSRIDILTEYANDIWSYDPDCYIILEHLGDFGEERVLADLGMMLWGNINHNYGEAVMGFTSTSGLAGGLHTTRGFAEPNLIAYMESHDEERNMYRALNFGNSEGSYDTRDFDTAIDRVKLASTFFFTLPGPKMIWQFGELGYEFSINRCTNGTINENCRLDRKPIRWDFAEDDKRLELYKHTRQLLELRETYDLSTVDNIKQLLSGPIKKVELRKGNAYFFMVGNFYVVEETTNLEFSQRGVWKDIFTGEEVDNSVNNVSTTLAPGEYRLFTNLGITVSNQDVENLRDDLRIYPNPVEHTLHLDGAFEGGRAEIIDVNGRIIHSVNLVRNKIDLSFLEKGYYTLRLFHEKGLNQSSFIKI